MNDLAAALSQRAAQLRHEFDRAFAAPPPVPQAAPVDLLAIRLGAEPYALRLAEVGGLFADKKLTRLPQAGHACLGIAGFRGSLVPVYDLRVLLDCPGRAAPRWLVVTADGTLALAFDAFDGHLRLAPDSLAQPEQGAAAHPHIHGLARAEARSPGPLRTIVNLASVLKAVERRAREPAPTT
jgi:purine-binding chemotaxis protein CheW